jgi:hypothetical protein
MSPVVLAWIQAFANALVPAMFALALVWLRQHKVNTTVIEAVGRAAGEVYKQIVQSGAPVTDRASLAAAVAEGRDYLQARIPDALKAAGITPEGAAQMVSAELGKLLAIDPTVGVGLRNIGNSLTLAAGRLAGTVAGTAAAIPIASSAAAAAPPT